MRIGLIGAGAFGKKHLAALNAVSGAEVATVVSAKKAEAEKLAAAFGVRDAGDDFEAVLARKDVDALILATPTPLHARQAIQCLEAGKHVQVEIPLCDILAEGEAVLRKQQQTELICMVGHTRRFNPSHQWVKRRIETGQFELHAMSVETLFFRRSNVNADGHPRDWTDHLLWHHVAHAVDLFQYMTGEPIVAANALEGPRDPALGIAMDMSVQMKTQKGKLLTLTLSFNNAGPLGSTFRYIGDTGTYIARYDDLFTGTGEAIDVGTVHVSTHGIELQDREFLSAICDGREPNASVAQVIGCYRLLGDLELKLRIP
jgi:2-hydroxy-4-carboxymuconate semialdehyde hemiacetal dehydrogenase